MLRKRFTKVSDALKEIEKKADAKTVKYLTGKKKMIWLIIHLTIIKRV